MENKSTELAQNPPFCKTDVSGSIKELNHYCRRRDCVFHNGISKRENVMCSHKKPDVVSDKDGMKRCFSYCH